MKNFIFQNPTKLVFGQGQISKLGQLIPENARLMITYGGGSVKKNGVYEQVVEALKGRSYVEFWGIEANPHVETLRKAICLGKEKNIDFVLAVGGGSVLDGTKLIAAGIATDIDAWDIVTQGVAHQQISFASVITVPATGSEMNSGAVITCEATKEKRVFGGTYPKFSVLDPEVTYSLSDHQIACGLADAFTHVLEQYLTVTEESRIMDRWAEGLLLSIVEIAPKIKQNHKDYDLMSDYMLAATFALNDFIRMGVSQDWATHMIGHELTALHGVTHGHSLAIIMPSTMNIMKEQKKDKILQFGKRVLGIDHEDENQIVEKTIEATKKFYLSLGLTIKLSDIGIGTDTIDIIASRFRNRGIALGEGKNITDDVVRKILVDCL